MQLMEKRVDMTQVMRDQQGAPVTEMMSAPTKWWRPFAPMLLQFARPFTRHAAKWAAWALMLNLLWEAAQLPFYSLAPTVGPLGIAGDVMHCTAGDTGIALASFGAAALATRDFEWPVRRPWFGLAVALVVGLVWTVQSEWRNVYVQGSWAYAPSMPTISGVGVLPILQWLLLPPLGLAMVRRQRHAVASGAERGTRIESRGPRRRNAAERRQTP